MVTERASLLSQDDASGEQFDQYSDVNIRHGFIRKVFGILTVQLMITCAICAPFVMYNEVVREHMTSTSFSVALVAVSIMTIAAICYMSCKPEAARKYPTNYILLAVITVGMGITTGVTTTRFDPISVIGVAALTGGIVFCLMLFAMQTKFDFTGFGPYLFAGLIFLTLFGIVLIFVQSETGRLIRAIIGALLFSMYIIYDTQLIVGGKNRKHQMSIDDYVFGALMLYMDIINLFLYLLELFGDRR